jgi:hypothetical protein
MNVIRISLIILSAVLTKASASAQQAKVECAITHNASGELRESVRELGFTFKGYDRLCRLMDENDLLLDVRTQSGVLQGRSYGWVSVALKRNRSGVVGTMVSNSTFISTDVSTPDARRIQLEALNDAVEGIAKEAEVYATSVVEAERKATLALSPIQP